MEVDCIFCKICNGQVPCSKIYEDENFLAFFDIQQFTPGHTLVIPKKHTRFVWDVENYSDYLLVTKKIAEHYKSLGFAYVDTLIFGRGVAHAHIHLVPHNTDCEGWNIALESIEKLGKQEHASLTKEKAALLLKRFSLIQ